MLWRDEVEVRPEDEVPRALPPEEGVPPLGAALNVVVPPPPRVRRLDDVRRASATLALSSEAVGGGLVREVHNLTADHRLI